MRMEESKCLEGVNPDSQSFGNEPEYWMRLQNHYLFRKTER